MGQRSRVDHNNQKSRSVSYSSNRSVNKLTRRFDLPVPTVAAQHAVQTTELQRKLAKVSNKDIGVARILSEGCTFSYQKADDLFLVVALEERLNTPPNLTAGGALRVLGGAITHFPVNYA